MNKITGKNKKCCVYGGEYRKKDYREKTIHWNYLGLDENEWCRV